MENFKNLSNMIQMLPGKRLVSQAVVEYMPATNVAEPRVKQQVRRLTRPLRCILPKTAEITFFE